MNMPFFLKISPEKLVTGPVPPPHAVFLVLIIAFTSTLIVCIGGCDSTYSQRSSETPSFTSIETDSFELLYQGGYVFSNREHFVGIDVSRWGLDAASEVREIVSSCECVQASLIQLEQEPRKQLLVVHVESDQQLARNVPLAVGIEVILSDGSKRNATFEFTHLASVTSEREE